MKNRLASAPVGLVVLAMIVAALPAAAQNLVVNATFDYDIVGWSAGSSNTVSFRPSDGSTLAGGSGAGSIEVTSNAHNGALQGGTQQVAGVGGVEYEFYASYYLPSTDNPADRVSFSMTWIGEYGSVTGNTWVSAYPYVQDSWARVSGTGIAPAGTTAIRIDLYVGNPSDSTETRDGFAYFDDVWFAELGATTATQELFVPVAASKGGKKGTYWTSDLWITNLIGFPITLEGAVLLAGQDNSAAVASPTMLATIPANGFVKLADVIATLGQSVTGGIYLKGTAQAAGLPATMMVAASRNSTPNTAGPGSFGQGMPVLGPGAKGSTSAPGVFENTSWRTNVGVLNTSALTVEVQVVVRDTTGATAGSATWTLPPYAHKMVSVTDLGVTTIDGGTVFFTRKSTLGSFTGFASLADNLSGDSVFTAAQ